MANHPNRNRSYYGFEHAYGADKRDEQGRPIGSLRSFRSRADRDAWVERGNPYQYDPGSRDALTSAEARKLRHW